MAVGEGEFSGDGGLISARRRPLRIIGQEAGPLVQGVNEELMEIYATNVSGVDSDGNPVEPGLMAPETSGLTFRSTGR